MEISELCEKLKRIEEQLPEHDVQGISWWNGGWELRVRVLRVNGAGINEPVSEVWSLRDGARV